MGRTNGKLIPFLKHGLENNLYANLKYEPDSYVFYIELPRYDRTKEMKLYEHMLMEWYKCNQNEDKYGSYSNAKAVFQASLKKSVYLVAENQINKKLRYHFGSSDEIKEKQRKLNARTKAKSSCLFYNSMAVSSDGFYETSTVTDKVVNLPPVANQLEMYNPPSVKSSSSGYVTGEEVEENASDFHEQDEEVKFFNGSLDSNFDFLNSFINDMKMDQDDLGLENIQVDDLFKPVEPLQSSLNNEVEEINVTAVDISEFVKKKTYWLCNKKLNLDSILLLICEKQPLEEGSEISEGTAVIPNGVWEPGISYDLKKSFELDEKLFVFLSPRF